MGLIEDVGRGPVAVDSAAFIYFIETHPVYLPPLRPLFAAADRLELTIVTSAVTLLEVLVVPYRAGDLALANRYEALLMRSRGVVLRDIDRALLRAAAQLRAVSAVRTRDALQFAAALAERCSAFIPARTAGSSARRLRLATSGPGGTLRTVHAEHRLDKLRELSAGEY